jgi:hypothetical protein
MPRKQRPFCSICFEPVRGRDMCRPNPCQDRRHRHHQACMDKWRQQKPRAQCIDCFPAGPDPAPAPAPAAAPEPQSRRNNTVFEIAPGVRVLPCPRCGILIERVSGCSSMKCARCLWKFNWPMTNKEALYEIVVFFGTLLFVLLVAGPTLSFLVYNGFIAGFISSDPAHQAYINTYGAVPASIAATRQAIRDQIKELEKHISALDRINQGAAEEYTMHLLVTMVMILLFMFVLCAIQTIHTHQYPAWFIRTRCYAWCRTLIEE